MRAAIYHAVVAGSYVALLVLQIVWHALLPAPYGASAWWLGLLAALPLLLPLKGVLKGQIRSMTWAGYLLLFYLVIGVMEAWSNPPQRWPALIQSGLVAVSIAAMLGFSRESR
jgi:uncharacterized membrane protein